MSVRLYRLMYSISTPAIPGPRFQEIPFDAGNVCLSICCLVFAYSANLATLAGRNKSASGSSTVLRDERNSQVI